MEAINSSINKPVSQATPGVESRMIELLEDLLWERGQLGLPGFLPEDRQRYYRSEADLLYTVLGWYGNPFRVDPTKAIEVYREIKRQIKESNW